MHEQNDAPDPIRVLQVVDKFSIDGRSIHGVARLLSWWINVIDKERFELGILGLKGRSQAGRYLEEQGGQLFYSDRGKLNPLAIFDIITTARQIKADILHLHGYRACTFGRFAGALLGIPSILHEHAVFPSIPLYQKVADRMLAPLSEKTIVNCGAVAEFCTEHRSMDPEKVEVIFNGIPLDEFRDVPEREAQTVAEELGLDSSAPIIGTVARLDEQKGVEYFLDAVPAIQAEIPEIKVLIVGDGSLRVELEEKAEHLGIAGDVVFTGERRDVPRLYKLMDVKVISSIYEGTTLTVFEAMAAGTPVVSTAVDGVKEVIDDGTSGILVEPRNPKAIADAVMDLLRSEERRQEIAERAKKRVREYDVRASMRRIETIYQEVLA